MTGGAAAKRRVGVPKGEAALTGLLPAAAETLTGGGHGVSVVCIAEAEIGTGVPDALLVVLPRSVLQSRRNAGPRIASLAHARALGALRSRTHAPYSDGYCRKLENDLRDAGWPVETLHRDGPGCGVESSLVVEAKMSDWRRGVFQLSRYRWAAHRGALLVPAHVAANVAPAALRHNRIGVLVPDGETVRFEVPAPAAALGWATHQWITELAVRTVEQRATAAAPAT